MADADEARVLAKYLIGCEIDDKCAYLYSRAISRLEPAIDKKDRAILAFALRHPRAIGALDAGLAFRRPASILRMKLFLMSAILEVRPEFSQKFLPANHSFTEVAALFYCASRAVARAIAGCLLLMWIR